MSTRLEKFLKNIGTYMITDDLKIELLDRFYDAEKMHEDLRRAGFPDDLTFPDTTAYINSLRPLPDDFISIILKWLPERKYKDSAIDYLREAKHRYDGRVLIPIFMTGSFDIRWKIADAITYNPPLYIDDWIKEVYLSPEYGEEAGLLALAVIKVFKKEEAIKILKQGFDLHPEVTPEALGKVGRLEEINFLEKKAQLHYEAKFIYKEIERAIKRIKKKYKSSSKMDK